jgi:lipopolysaccharide/colanic/teichoic acid biosynthesis glycosyltransferase
LLACSQILTAVLVGHISVQMVGHFPAQFNSMNKPKAAERRYQKSSSGIAGESDLDIAGIL